MPVAARMACLRQAAPNSRRRWRRRLRTSCPTAIARRGTGFLAVSGGSTPALLFAELSQGRDRVEKRDRHADRRAAGAADLAALERQAGRRQASAGAGGGGAFRAALPWNRRSPKRPQRWPGRRSASCPGRSTSRCSAWERTATRRRSSPTRRTSPTLLGRRRGEAGAAGRGGECRRAAADADARQDRRGRFAGAAHRGRGEAAGARPGARRREAADPCRLRGARRGRWRYSGPNRPVSGPLQALFRASAGKPPTFPLHAGRTTDDGKKRHRGDHRPHPRALEAGRDIYLDRIPRRPDAAPIARCSPAATSRMASPCAARRRRSRSAATGCPTSASSPPTTTCCRRISPSRPIRS